MGLMYLNKKTSMSFVLILRIKLKIKQEIYKKNAVGQNYDFFLELYDLCNMPFSKYTMFNRRPITYLKS